MQTEMDIYIEATDQLIPVYGDIWKLSNTIFDIIARKGLTFTLSMGMLDELYMDTIRGALVSIFNRFFEEELKVTVFTFDKELEMAGLPKCAVKEQKRWLAYMEKQIANNIMLIAKERGILKK
jgi:hypothetical protein